ncbi:MAG: response regulator [Magnetococcales bacterium]|nr:response regulator [Magnetococcales bacterium]
MDRKPDNGMNEGGTDMVFTRIWQRLRLDVKLIGSTLVLLAIPTVLLGWHTITTEQRALQERIDSQGTSLAEAAAIFSIEPLLTLDDTILAGYVKRLTRTQYDVDFVRILDINGRVVAHAQAPDPVAFTSDHGAVQLFRANVLVEPDDTEPIGVVELGLSTRHADQAATARMHRLIAAFLGIFLLLGFSLSLLLKKNVTDPVRRLDRHAKALGQGDMESVIVIPSEDEMGRLAAAMDAMRRDIRESHAVVRRQEEYVASLVDSALDMILTVDPSQRIVVFNPAAQKTYGYGMDEVTGQPAALLCADPAEAERMFATIHAGGKFIGELTGRRKDGTTFPVFMSASLLKDRKGQVIGALASSRDITEQKQVAALERARKAAEAANQAKSAFLAVMSHEIRSPMNGVIGMADLLSATELADEQRQYVEIILRSSHSLLALLNDILDFSKVEAGAMKLEYTDFKPREVVRMACEILAATARSKGLALHEEIDPGVPECVSGDALRLRQILVNLVGNAIKFTPAGEARVRVVVAGGEPALEGFPIQLQFTVADTGVGVPLDKQEIIFDRFSQADLSTTRRFGGVGLGLTISRQLVELMHGRMWLESGGENQGSAFHFLARFQPCRAGAVKVASSDAPLVESRVLRVLVVDDGVDNRILAAHILGRVGHVVEQAVDGLDALDKLAHASFDVVLMDVQMPEMDGIVATRQIRDGVLGATVARVPILGVSAGALQEEMERGLAAGMDEFLTKPYRARVLLEAVTRLAGRGGVL